jgi:ADP-ribose pyrophosphatase
MGKRRQIYQGRILNLVLEDEFYEIIEHQDAVSILAEEAGKILFVRQYRPAVGGYTLELPAGLIEKGEAPLQAAQRELAEEAQLTGHLELLTQFFVSPGFCNENVYLFRASALRPQAATPDDDEDLTVVWASPRDVLQQAGTGQLALSSATMAGLLWYLAFPSPNHAAD